jgi:DNA-binding response OmpR family regulator
VPQMTVLVIEDDANMVDLYRTVLSANGFHVLHATSLLEAEAIIEGGEDFDAVIVDGNIVGGNTTRLVAEIRFRYSNVVVIAATNDDDLKNALMRAGADIHVPKHDAPHRLVTILLDDKPRPA